MTRIHSLPKSIVTYLLIASLIVCSSCSNRLKITDKNVRELIERVDKATLNKDYDGIIAEVASNAKIVITNADAGKTTTFTKESYKAGLIQTLSNISEYKHSRTTSQIQIDPSGESATAMDVVYESMTVGGLIVSGRTIETTTFGIENGKVVVTSVRGIVTFD
jgi:hypothetical protein